MKKQISSVFLLCGVLVTLSLSASEGRGLVIRDFSKRGSTVIESAHVKPEQDAAQEQKAAQEEALKIQQAKNRAALEETKGRPIFPEGHDALAKRTEVIQSMEQLFPMDGKEAVKSTNAKASVPKPGVHLEHVKSVGEQILDEVNDITKDIDSNKKESIAKNLLDLKSDNPVATQQTIEAAHKAKLKALNESLSDNFTIWNKIKSENPNLMDSGIQKLYDVHVEEIFKEGERRLNAARDFLIQDLKAKKAGSGFQRSDFEDNKTKNKSADDNKTFDTKLVKDNKSTDLDNKSVDKPGMIKKFANKIARWWSSWGKDNEKTYVQTVLKQVFDGGENMTDLSHEVENKFNEIKNDNKSQNDNKLKTVISNMQEEINRVVKERLKSAKTQEERKSIEAIGESLRTSLEKDDRSW